MAVFGQHEQVLGVQDADNFVMVVFVDGNPGERRFRDQFQGFARGGIGGERHDVRTRHQNLADLVVAEFQDAFDHLALVFFDDAARFDFR